MDKERLKEYRWILENVQELENRLLEIDTKLQHITSSLDANKVQTTKNNDKWTNLVAERIQVCDMINDELAKSFKEMRLIEKAISNLPAREKLLMRYRYIDGYSWIEICYKMNYEWAQVHRIHSKILQKMVQNDTLKVCYSIK
jgi:DNA-directed RNA polymerase specialized sigma subunit